MGLIATLIIFAIAQFVYLKYKRNYLLPVFTTTVILVAIILMTDTNYEAYYVSAQWIDWLLGPAVVALSFPLYKHRKMLFKYKRTIVSWVFIAAVIGIVSGAGVLALFPVADSYIVTAMLKNTTAPVAIEIANIYGGIPALTAVICTLSGILGAVVGPTIFDKFSVKSSLAKGIAMGATSHAIGTARLMEEDDYAGAISTIAFLLMTIIMTMLTPLGA
ncbi:LrgB family protein [Bacillus shivajii]|uniref:LrgB family protein n=1 Tax=Bacillus shivajii TaxID=1983719 RepID=UPI001CFB905B|nr:LrgB family protein [Bacillus shivajii]UCZ52856.1 LrgB family protein [Bacillus shivajii]